MAPEKRLAIIKTMAASSRLMIAKAERRFPVRIRVAVPPNGFGRRLDDMMTRREQRR